MIQGTLNYTEMGKKINKKAINFFLLIVIFQALHSTEEYLGALWESFPPAAYLCGLISSNLETGFLVINIGLFVVGILVWFFVVKAKKTYAWTLIWIWIVIEIVNGIGHPAWSVIQQRYTPGVITAPFLLLIAILLIWTYRLSEEEK